MSAALVVTQFADQYAKQKASWSTDWPGFVEWLDGLPPCRSKDQAQWVKLAEFGDTPTPKGCLRHNANMVSIGGVEGDYDGEQVHPEQALGMLEAHNLRAVIVTTYSHAPDAPRWRVFAPLSKGHTPDERKRLVAGLNGALGGILTNESFTQSQGFYVGGPEGGEYKVMHAFGDPEDGIALDQWDDLDLHATYKGSGEGGNDPGESVEEWKTQVSDGEQLNPTACRLVGHYVRKGLDDDDIRALMESRLLNGDAADYRPDRVREYLDGGEFQRQLDGARGKGYAPGPEPGSEPDAESKPEIETRFRLVRAGDLEITPPDWLVEDRLEVDTLGLIFGDPKAGKSFIAVDKACSVATGTEYHGCGIEQAPVIYIAGEGHKGIGRRLRAWEIARGVSLDSAPLYVSAKAAALLEPASVDAVVEAVNEIAADQGTPGLVVIDTLARNFGPGDENSTPDMNLFVQAADRIRTAYGAAVLIVHHTGHVDKQRARGSIALKGAIDVEFRVDKGEDDVVRLECTAMKDWKPPEAMAFRLSTVEIGIQDHRGREVTSAVADSTEYAPPPRKGKEGKGRWQTMALTNLVALNKKHRANVEAQGRDPDTARVSLEVWRDDCVHHGMPRARWYEVKAKLAEQGKVEIEQGFVRPLLSGGGGTDGS